jgi:phytoene desaturase
MSDASGRRPRRVVVVGAGLAGLSAACHLRGRGHDVTVVEAGSGPGGRAGSLERDGYRFDTGPTVLTLPHLIDGCFEALGVDPRDYWTYRPIDPVYRACYADGSEILVRHGREAMTDEIHDVCGPAEALAFGRFCRWLEQLHDVEMPHFIDRNLDSPLSLLAHPPALARLVRLGGFRRLDAAVRSHFDDERLVRLFSFQSMYAGVAPHRALALYAVITYMDTVSGVYHADGGVHAVPAAMARAAADAGVRFAYDAPVERIELADGNSGPVRGVVLISGERVTADAVVCTVDLPVAYRTLVPDLPAPRRLAHMTYAPSAIVWHGGVAGDLPAGTAHHNIHFGESWRGAFDDLFGGSRMRDPSILVTVPTVDEPSMAPPDRHVLFALEPVPNLDGSVDWRFERARARDELVARVGKLGYPVDVDVEEFVDPTDWAAAQMERGTPFALSHTFLQSGPFRPANVRRRAPGLVFAGSGTVPGVGVPMVLISGRLAADRVDELDELDRSDGVGEAP